MSKDKTEKIMLTIHVDDGIIACQNKQKIQSLISHLQKDFKMTICKLNVFLGIEITRLTNGCLFISQSEFIKTIVKRFNMENANEVCTPFDSQRKLENFKNDNILSNIPYKEAVGSLMFLAIISRPDISFSVGVLSMYADKPAQGH